jgi:hypothetical protein
VVVRELVVPIRQWWWNAFPHSDFPRQIPTWLPEIGSDTLRDFIEFTADASLVESLESGLRVAWISRADLEEIGRQDWFWREFYRRHPSATGYIELSRLGWSSGRREALGYCGRMSESLSGTGLLVILRHDGQHWAAVRWRQVWQA